MDYLVTILCSMFGALIGAAVAALLMSRRIQPPPSEVEARLWRNALQVAESNQEKLQKQIADRDRIIRERSEELDERERRLGFALAETEKEAAQRTAAEQKLLDLASEAADHAAHRAEMEARWESEKSGVAEEAGRQAASFQAQLDAARRQIQELDAEVARLGAECVESKVQLGAELERTRQLTAEVAALQSERQSAAKGIEMLLLAQQNLSLLLKPVREDGPHGSNGGPPVEAVSIPPNLLPTTGPED